MTARPERPQGLGRGLASLIPQRSPGQPMAIEIPISRIRPNPHQPRKRFDDEELASLRAEHRRARRSSSRSWSPRRSTATSSSRASGGCAPPRRPASSASPRSSASSPTASSSSSPSSRTSSARTSIRSRRRRRYRQLIEEFGFSQDEVATRVGKARSTVANTLRLLDLAPGVQAAVADGRLTEGHGRALGGLARRAPGPRPRLRHRARSCPFARPKSSSRRLREPKPEPPAPPAPGGPTRSSSASRRTSDARSAPKSALPDRGAAAGSSSSTTATKNSGGSTSA